MGFIHGLVAALSYEPPKRKRLVKYRWSFRIPILSFFFPGLEWKFGPERREWRK